VKFIFNNNKTLRKTFYRQQQQLITMITELCNMKGLNHPSCLNQTPRLFLQNASTLMQAKTFNGGTLNVLKYM